MAKGMQMKQETRIALEIMREVGRSSNVASAFLDSIFAKIRPDELVALLDSRVNEVTVTLSQMPIITKAINKVLDKYNIKEPTEGMSKIAVETIDDVLAGSDVGIISEEIKKKVDEEFPEKPEESEEPEESKKPEEGE